MANASVTVTDLDKDNQAVNLGTSNEIKPDTAMGGSGVYMSKGSIAILVCTVVALLVAEGLIVGLVGRPDCSVYTTVTNAPTKAPPPPAETTADVTTSAEPMGPWSNVRLPDNLVPIEYNVELRPVLEMDASGRYLFYGSSSVTYTCVKPTNNVILHSNKLNYTKDDVTLTEEGTAFPIKSMMFYQTNEFVIFETEADCVEGKTYTLIFSNFVSELSGDLNGLYRSQYTKPSGENKVIATSQMQVTGARETFPCFDEPALKANFTVKMWYRADTGDYALSNMPPDTYESKMIEGQMWNSTTFKETVPMSTYLLAMIVSDFTYEETFSKNGIQTRIYARKETVDNDEAVYASEITPVILEYFVDYFSVPYPLPKSDQVAVSDFGAGAMENWGLVIYRETYLLYNDAVSSVFDKRRCTSVVAHELAHQWFGNLVSPAWWDDTWLNEGFASYVAYLGEKAVQPTWESMERFLLGENQLAMEVDGLTSSHPLVQPVSSPSEISSQFDDISYSKGAAILRMIDGILTTENFVGGLTQYLNDLAYDAATHDDLFQHWEDQANNVGLDLPDDLTKILETWTLQMGYPVVNIMRQDSLSTVFDVTQEYFLLDATATPVHTPGSLKYGYQWYVPLTYKKSAQIGTDNKEEVWLVPDPPSTVTIAEGEYLLANIDGVGYYRVNYDETNWKKLVSRLNSNSFKDISGSNRAQLIDDAFSLARPGLLSITIGMDMSKYMLREDAYTPWKTFMDRIKFVEYMIGRTKNYGTFAKYIVSLVEPTLYFKYGWEENNKTDEAQIQRMTKEVGIEGACYYGSEDCIANASRLYREWMNNSADTSIISNTYRDDVYCAAIRNGGVEEWNFAWERHNNLSNAQEQASLRYGMSCSKEPWILTRFMNYCVDLKYIRRQDGLRTCLQYIGSHEYGRDLAWAFMVDNWDMLVVEYGSGITFDSLIEIITRRFSTEYDLQLLQDFKDSTTNLGTAIRAVDQAIERTRTNIRWRETNEEVLANWLQDNVAEPV